MNINLFYIQYILTLLYQNKCDKPRVSALNFFSVVLKEKRRWAGLGRQRAGLCCGPRSMLATGSKTGMIKLAEGRSTGGHNIHLTSD